MTAPAARHVDPALARLEGEAATQIALDGASGEIPVRVPRAVPPGTYHGEPVLKAPVWEWPVPAYFYVGGVAAGAGVLGAAAQLLGGPRLARLVRRARWTAAAGTAAGSLLLVRDLGRPARFVRMLRVFRPTSPMNVGTWVLSAAGALSWTSAFLGERRGIAGVAGRAAGVGLGVAALPLAGYTAVLLANTAVPAWQGTRRSLPFLFVGAAMGGAGAVLELLGTDAAEAPVARRFMLAGEAVELLGTVAVEVEAGRQPRGARAFRDGASGRLWRAARLVTAGAFALSLAAPGRRARRLAALAAVAGGVALRFAVVEAGGARRAIRARRSSRNARRSIAPATTCRRAPEAHGRRASGPRPASRPRRSRPTPRRRRVGGGRPPSRARA